MVYGVLFDLILIYFTIGMLIMKVRSNRTITVELSITLSTLGSTYLLVYYVDDVDYVDYLTLIDDYLLLYLDLDYYYEYYYDYYINYKDYC